LARAMDIQTDKNYLFQLKEELDLMSRIPEKFEQQATMTEAQFQDFPSIRKMFHEKQLNVKVLDAHKECTETLNTLQNSIFNCANILREIWDKQERDIQKQTEKVEFAQQVFRY
jgi:hypothetical protein